MGNIRFWRFWFAKKDVKVDTIVKLRQALSKTKAGNFHISIGFGWEKMDFTPY